MNEEHLYDGHSGNHLSFQRINKLGHEWIYVSASPHKGMVTSHDPATPFSIVHSPDCPCMMEGLSVKLFSQNKKINQDDLQLLRSLKPEYEASFSGDEAEDWGYIVARATGTNNDYPDINTYVAILSDKRVTVGALVGEHYKNPNVLLVTYCFIDRRFRRAGKGYAKRLVETAVPEIRRLAQMPTDVANVFFEGENPDMMDLQSIAEAAFNPTFRLAWFRSLGAQRLEFDYRQPPLSANQQPVKWLSMYCLGNSEVKKKTLKDFLTEFYRVLGKNVKGEENEKEYQKCLEKQLRQIDSIPGDFVWTVTY